MTDKDQQQIYPVPQNHTTTTQSKHDVESATMDSKELRKKKRLKCLAYVAAFAVFQTGVILIFVFTIMKLRTPKFRVRSASFESLEVGTAANPSFNLKMDAELGVKNANFGNYKFHNSTIVFLYGGTPVGEAAVRKTKAGWRSTKKLGVVVDLSSKGLPNNSQLGNDLNSGVLTLNSRSSLNGKVELLFIFKKKKTINMDCSLTIGLAEKVVRQISCK